jgi:hypothetical protein
LVGGRDVGTGVVKGERTDGGIVCLEDGFKIERQPVPGREFPTSGTSQYTTTLRRPLGATSGWEKIDDTRTKCTTCDGIGWTWILFVDVWMNFVQSDVEALSG